MARASVRVGAPHPAPALPPAPWGGPRRAVPEGSVAAVSDVEEPPRHGWSRRSVLRGLGVVGASAATGAVAGARAGADTGSDPPIDYAYGGEDDGEGRFDDWGELVAALGEAPPGDKWVAVDGDATVPAGTWDLNGAGFRGREDAGVGLPPNGHPVVLRFADGARLVNPSRRFARDGIVLLSASRSPVVTIDDERSYYFEDDAWVASTAGAFFEVTADAGTLVLFSFRTGSGLVHAGTAGETGPARPSIHHRGSATVIVALATGNHIFDDDTISGNGVVVAAISSAAGIREPGAPRGGFRHRDAASVTPLLFSTAENVAVTPSRPQDWPEAPTDLARAVDLLAARVAALEG